ELLLVNPAFLVDLGVAVETRGNFLLQRRVRQQIASELGDGELVEWQVPVQRINYPVAVFPDFSRCINAVTVGVGVTRHVEPPAAPAFAVMWRSQQSLNKFF